MVDGDIVTSGRSYRIFLCFIFGASHTHINNTENTMMLCEITTGMANFFK